MVWTAISEPAAVVGAVGTWFHVALLGRTLAYNGLAAVIAGVLGLPGAKVIGTGTSVQRGAALVLAAGSLLVPSLVYAYGFQQFLRLTGTSPEPGSWWDVMRCSWTLGAWLWGVPAVVVGLAWRRLDPVVMQQARLDGATGRVTARLLAAPFVAGVMLSAALASQEFGVYEPTGISVTATEVRMLFDTGAFSSRENPITQSLSGMGGAALSAQGQAARASAALRASLPTLLATLVLAALAARLVRGLLERPAEVPEIAGRVERGGGLGVGEYGWGFWSGG